MRSVSGSQTITSARDEIYKPAVAEKLKLLAYLRPDVLVAGIEIDEEVAPERGVSHRPESTACRMVNTL
jgi:hypothetical protein